MEEPGVNYYGARYLDPKYSRWLSGDPALGDYVPAAGTDPSKLAGMGGVYNTVNLHLYHYAGNNPVKYTDPDGREDDIETIYAKYMDLALSSQKAGSTVAASNINYEKEF